MGNNLQTIEINGRIFDARTGKPLGHHEAHAKPALKRVVMDVARGRAAAHGVHKTPQRSHTLMRHAVKKPRSVQAAINKPVVARAVEDVVAPVSSGNPTITRRLDTAREQRAHKIKQSSLVSRFNDFSSNLNKPITPVVKPLAVQPAPVLQAAPTPRRHTSHPSTNALIARSLQNASSHTETHKPKRSHARKRSRLASAAAGTMALLLLGGFFMYQNIPNISMRYAAARAGVEAKLPGYKPAGFALNSHIQYGPGQITMNFKSNADDRNFTITQRESNWSSETLRNNYVSNVDSSIHNYEDKGRTIYLYGDSNATWISGGVWYEINGNSGLNSDQLIRIATSM